MKDLFLTLALLLGIMQAGAQDTKYMSAMQKNKAMIDTAKETSTLQTAANNLERIAAVEKKEWLPDYYLAYCYTFIGFRETNNDRKDEILNKAMKHVDRADSISPENSEIYALRGLVQQMMLQVNPMVRGGIYGPKSSANFEKAMALDPDNPRPYYLQGQNLLYTPPMWGGGKDKALPILEKAVEKYSRFKPSGPLMPTWGEQRAKLLLEECRK